MEENGVNERDEGSEKYRYEENQIESERGKKLKEMDKKLIKDRMKCDRIKKKR